MSGQESFPFMTEPPAGRHEAPAAPPPGRALDRSLVLEAGAGTGKTTAIVCKVVEILLSEPEIDPGSIVLITFTDKAAAEIADRVREAMVSLERGFARGDPSWRSRRNGAVIWFVRPDRIEPWSAACRSQLQRLDRLRSQTIHSFCQGLLRHHPLEAGLDPWFELIQGFELDRLHEEIFDAWLDEDVADPEHRDDWELLYAHFRNLTEIGNQILRLTSQRDIVVDSRYSLGEIEEADATIRSWIAEAKDLTEEETGKIKNPANAEVIGYLRETDPPPVGTLEAWISWFRPIGLLLQDCDLVQRGPHKELIRKLRGDARKSQGKYLTIHELLRQHLVALAFRRTATRFFDALENEKRARGLVDFDDLLFRARDLLRNPAVLERVREEFRYVFVDEFQDTDRVQAEIVLRLSSDAHDDLVPGKTVLVGDPKQSIYSFRRADPEMYASTVAAFLGKGARQEFLEVNYRSDEPLLENFNAIFAKLFGEVEDDTGDDPGAALNRRLRSDDPLVIRPGYKRLRAANTGDEGQRARLHFIPATIQQGEPAERAQARAVARWLDAARRRGESLGRTAILLRKTPRIHDLLTTLDEWGIPYHLPPARSFLDRPAAVDLVAVIRAIAHPLDRGAVVSAARSPYLALSDDEIATHLLGLAHDEPCAWTRVGEQIAAWRAAAAEEPVAAVIDRVIDESEIEMLYAAMRGGDAMLAHLDRMRDLAIAFDRSTGDSLAAFVDDMTRRRDSWAEGEQPLAGEPDDAVRVMTVHGAKGLEFERVILPDLSPQFGSSRLDVSVVDALARIVFTGRLWSLSAKFSGPGGRPLEEVVSRREAAEEERLFYVAVTRASAQVVFVIHDKLNHERGFWRSMCDAFGLGSKGLLDGFPSRPGETELRDFALGGRTVRIAFHQLDDTASPRSSHRFVDPRIAAFAERPAETVEPPRLEPRERLDRRVVVAARSAVRRKPVGLLVHRVLERWNGDRDGIDSIVTALGAEAGVTSEVLDAARTIVARVLASENARRIFGPTLAGRELSIVHRDESGQVIQGRIDRLIRDEGGLTVVDYKTGRAEEARLDDDREQVRRYCDAIQVITGKPCRGLLWYIAEDRDQIVEV